MFKKYKKLNRVIIALCIIAVTISFMVVPAYATTDIDFIQDILPASSYTLFKNGIEIGVYDNPSLYLTNASSAGWRWNAISYNKVYGEFVFTIFCTTQPSTVRFVPYPGGNYYEAEYLGSGYHSYQYKVKRTVDISYPQIIAEWNSAYTGTYAIRDCVGILDTGVTANPISYYAYTDVNDLGDTSISSNNSLSVPGVLIQSILSQNGLYVDFWVRDTRCPLDMPASVVANVISLCDDLTFGAYLSSNCTVATLQDVDILHTFRVEQIKSLTSATYITDSVPFYSYYVVVDTAGVDFGDGAFHITASSDSVNQPYFEVSGLYFEVPVAETPWYKTFFGWISGAMDSMLNGIKNFFSPILSGIDSTLEDMLDALTSGSAEQQEQVADDSAQMADDGEKLGTLVDDMKVDQPDVSASDLSVDNLVDGNDLQLYTAPFLNLWDNPTLMAILTMVVSLVLVSFVFFGKKG